MSQDTDIVITGDVSGYTRSLQEAQAETNRTTQVVGGLGSAISNLHQNAKQKLVLVDAAASAALTAAVASAAKLEQSMSQLEARSKLTNTSFAQTTKAVGQLRTEFGMAAQSAAQLLSAMNAMGATGNQAPSMARNYVRMAAVTGESVGTLAAEQNQLMRSMNRGRLDMGTMENYSSMAAGLSARVGSPASSIMGFANRVSPLASTLGMSSRDVMGFSAAFQRAGQDGIAPATAFNKILTDINYSKQWGGPEAKQYAGYIGVSAEQFNKMPVADAVKAIFKKIGSEGPEAARFLDRQGLDGVRTQNAIMAISRSGDLDQTLNQSRELFGQTGTYKESYDAALSGLNDESEKVAQSFSRLADAIGAQLLPSLTAMTEFFNATVGKGMNAASNVLESVPDWMKMGIGTAVGIGGIAKAGNVLTGVNAALSSNVLASTIRGAIPMGISEARNPGGIDTPDAEMFRAGKGGLFRQFLYNTSQGTASRFLGRDTKKNPVKEAEEQESKVAQDIKAKTGEKVRIREEAQEKTRAETNAKVTQGIVGAAADFDVAVAGSGESLKKSLKKFNEKLDSGIDVGKSHRSGYNPSAWLQGTSSKVVNDKGLFGRIATGALGMIGDMAEDLSDPILHKSDYHKRATQRSMLGSKGNVAYKIGGFDNEGVESDSMRRRIATFMLGGTDGLDDRVADIREDRANREFRRGSRRGMSTGAAARRAAANVATTTLVAPAALAGQVGGGLLGRGVSALGGLALANPITTAAMVGGIALTPAINAYNEGQDRLKALASTDPSDRVRSSSEKLRDALGIASSAVESFADRLKGSTPGSAGPQSIEDALTTTEEEASKYGWKNRAAEVDEQYSELRNVSAGDTQKWQAFATTAMSGAQSIEGINAVSQAMIGKGVDEATASKIAQQAWVDSKDSQKLMEAIFTQVSSDDEEMAKAGKGALLDALNTAETYGKPGDSDKVLRSFAEYITSANNNATAGAGETNQAIVALASAAGAKIETGFFKNDLKDLRSTGVTPGERMGNFSVEDLYKLINKEGGRDLVAGGESGLIDQMVPPILSGHFKVKKSLQGLDYEDVVTSNMTKLTRRPDAEKIFADMELQGSVSKQYGLMSGKAGIQGYLNSATNAGASDAFREVSDGFAELAVNLKSANPALAEYATAMRSIAQELQSFSMREAGTTSLSDRGAVISGDIANAQRLVRLNPSSDEAVQLLTTSADQGMEHLGAIDSFVRSGAGRIRSMELSEKYANINIDRSQAYAREDRAQQLGWQKDDFDLSMKYRLEDFNRSRKYSEEDFALSRARAWEDYNRSRERDEQNFQRMRARAEADYARQLMRQNRNWDRDRKRQQDDFNRGRLREEEDFNHRIEMMAKETAKSVFDVYSRVGVERTWSVQNLLQNMADQQRYLEEQLKNLDEARRLGLSDEAIQTLGLSDSSKAQQLQRIVDDLRATPSQAGDINKMVQSRIASSGDLLKDKSNSQWEEMMYQRDKSLAQQLEDYERSRTRSQDDYRQSLSDSLEDFRRSIKEQDEDREIALQQSEDDFRRGMSRQLSDFQKNNARSLIEFEESGRRAHEAFDKQLSQSATLFEKSLSRQRDDLKFSQKLARQQLSDELEFITMSTEDAFDILNKNLSGKTQDQLARYKEIYDEIRKQVLSVKGVVEDTYKDLGIPVQTQMNGQRHDPRTMKTMGGPDSNSAIGMANVLGGGTGDVHSGGEQTSPATGGITQGFHQRHPGVDIAGHMGDPIHAARSGVVSFVGDGGPYGRFTKIRHDGGAESWYGHQSIQGVTAGQNVNAGDVIGRIGDTGKSTGPHLHFEFRMNGQAVDPSKLTSTSTVEGGIGGPFLEEALKKANYPKAFEGWEKAIDKTSFRGRIKRGATAKWWEDKTRSDYEDFFGPETEGAFVSGSSVAGGAVRPVPQSHSGWNGGKYRSGKWHGGIDFPAPTGTEIRALWSGKVIKALALNRSYGHHVQLDHGSGLSTLYAHMSKILTSTGATVAPGQVIGRVGSTGNSTGPHLHLEVRKNGTQVNPDPYLSGKAAPAAGKKGTTKVGGHVIDNASYALLQQAQRIWGNKYNITQGVLRPSSSYSGSTHTGLGVIDTAPATVGAMNALRAVGAASWIRLPSEGPWNAHIHTVFPVSGLASSAYSQYQSYLAGRNGLGKKDRYDHVPVVNAGIASKASTGGYAGGTSSAAAGIREVGEHGIELVLGRGIKKFLGGETVLNPLQTRAAFSRPGQGQGVVPVPSAAPGNISYDNSFHVKEVHVVSQNPEEMRMKLVQRQRLMALSAGGRQ